MKRSELFTSIAVGFVCLAVTYGMGQIEWYYWERLNDGPTYSNTLELQLCFQSLKADLLQYKTKHKKFPTQLRRDDLTRFREDRKSAKFAADGQPLDPWQRPYLYQCPLENEDIVLRSNADVIRSLGRDGVAGGRLQDADLSLNRDRSDECYPTLLEYLWDHSEILDAERRYPEMMGIECVFVSLVSFLIIIFTSNRRPSSKPTSSRILGMIFISMILGVIVTPVLIIAREVAQIFLETITLHGHFP